MAKLEKSLKQSSAQEPVKTVTSGESDAEKLYVAHCERQVLQGVHPSMIGLAAVLRRPGETSH